MSKFAKVWLRPEVYPVLACIGAGLALCTWFGTRQLRLHNDIVINKNQPRQYMERPYPKIVPNGYRTHMQPHEATPRQLKQ